MRRLTAWLRRSDVSIILITSLVWLTAITAIVIANTAASTMWHPLDANRDGMVDTADCALIDSIAKGAVATRQIIDRCDVDGDGLVTVRDARLVFDHFMQADRLDVTGNGKVSSSDAGQIASVMAGHPATEETVRRCDVNGDGVVTQADAELVLRYIMERPQ